MTKTSAFTRRHRVEHMPYYSGSMITGLFFSFKLETSIKFVDLK
jgi:hypothetical protein